MVSGVPYDVVSARADFVLGSILNGAGMILLRFLIAAPMTSL